MSRLGPLPEQPTFNALVPHMDLRDAIRIEKGLEPLDEKDVPRYGESPPALFQGLDSEPVTIGRFSESAWAFKWDQTTLGAIVFAVLVALWFVNSSIVIAVGIAGIVLIPLLRHR